MANETAQAFDNVLTKVLSRKTCTKEMFVRALVAALDKESLEESAYYGHPLVEAARKAIYPEDFEDGE